MSGRNGRTTPCRRPGRHYGLARHEAQPADPAAEPDRSLSEEQRKETRRAIVQELRREAGTLNAQGRFALRPGIKSDETSEADE